MKTKDLLPYEGLKVRMKYRNPLWRSNVDTFIGFLERHKTSKGNYWKIPCFTSKLTVEVKSCNIISIEVYTEPISNDFNDKECDIIKLLN